jgi:hypothetical protein
VWKVTVPRYEPVVVQTAIDGIETRALVRTHSVKNDNQLICDVVESQLRSPGDGTMDGIGISHPRFGTHKAVYHKGKGSSHRGGWLIIQTPNAR